MKLLIDAQLPRKLARFLSAKGYDCIHTLDLPNQNNTQDAETNRISIEQKRIVISKDVDFYNSYLQKLEPFKLVYLTAGNISTKELIELFEKIMKKYSKKFSLTRW
ncbi:MAG: DUF5615 family PIN-like protein [Thermonemataceae bacterium]